MLILLLILLMSVAAPKMGSVLMQEGANAQLDIQEVFASIL